MGFLTLGDFQDELATMLSVKGEGPPRGNRRLDRYINMGYLELTGTMDFNALFKIQTIATVADTKTYTLATSLQSVRAVIDTTNTYNLRRVTIENFFRLDPSNTGQPQRWARAAGLLYLWPVPDAVYSIDVMHNVEPTVLVADGDKTVLNSVWDQAILLFAGKAASMVDGDGDKVELFLSLARTYVQSRISDAEADHASQSVGVTVALDEDILTQQEF